METTTDTKPCVYCNGAGNVWGGGIYEPRRRCLICKGSGEAPADGVYRNPLTGKAM